MKTDYLKFLFLYLTFLLFSLIYGWEAKEGPITTNPVFSSDGRKIFFVTNVAYYKDYIWAINIDGSGLKKITFGDSPAVSPDGTKIVYEGIDGIWIMNSDGTGQRKVENKNCVPQWYPGTNKLLCFEDKIYLLDPISNEKYFLTQNLIRPSGKINPAGDKYVYEKCVKESTSLFENYFNLFIENLNGGGKKQITFGDYHDFNPSWHPDGTKIIFHSDRDNTNGIWEVNIDGTGLRCINPYGDYPVYSPDGTKIAFIREDNLWIMNSDGTGERQLTYFKEVVEPIVKVKFEPDKWNIEWLDEKQVQGYINCYIGGIKGDKSLGIEGYDVEEINVDTIKLEDQLSPEGPNQILQSHHGFDGKVIKVKFNKFKAIDTIQNLKLAYRHGIKDYEIKITGYMKDGQFFEGRTTIEIIGKLKELK